MVRVWCSLVTCWNEIWRSHFPRQGRSLTLQQPNVYLRGKWESGKTHSVLKSSETWPIPIRWRLLRKYMHPMWGKSSFSTSWYVWWRWLASHCSVRRSCFFPTRIACLISPILKSSFDEKYVSIGSFFPRRQRSENMIVEIWLKYSKQHVRFAAFEYMYDRAKSTGCTEVGTAGWVQRIEFQPKMLEQLHVQNKNSSHFENSNAGNFDTVKVLEQLRVFKPKNSSKCCNMWMFSESLDKEIQSSSQHGF